MQRYEGIMTFELSEMNGGVNGPMQSPFIPDNGHLEGHYTTYTMV